MSVNCSINQYYYYTGQGKKADRNKPSFSPLILCHQPRVSREGFEMIDVHIGKVIGQNFEVMLNYTWERYLLKMFSISGRHYLD